MSHLQEMAIQYTRDDYITDSESNREQVRVQWHKSPYYGVFISVAFLEKRFTEPNRLHRNRDSISCVVYLSKQSLS